LEDAGVSGWLGWGRWWWVDGDAAGFAFGAADGVAFLQRPVDGEFEALAGHAAVPRIPPARPAHLNNQASASRTDGGFAGEKVVFAAGKVKTVIVADVILRAVEAETAVHQGDVTEMPIAMVMWIFMQPPGFRRPKVFVEKFGAVGALDLCGGNLELFGDVFLFHITT